MLPEVCDWEGGVVSHVVFSRDTQLPRVGVFARYVQWWEKGPGGLNVFIAEELK